MGGGWDQEREMAEEFSVCALRLVMGAPVRGWRGEDVEM